MTTAFALGWRDGYAGHKPLSRSPEYMDGYRSGECERYHEERYWGEEATLQAWGARR